VSACAIQNIDETVKFWPGGSSLNGAVGNAHSSLPWRLPDSSGCPGWVKNGRDALEMGCLYYPRKQTSVSYAACYGAATVYDKHLASTLHCVDDEISNG
jgi:hypothetical protein